MSKSSTVSIVSTKKLANCSIPPGQQSETERCFLAAKNVNELQSFLGGVSNERGGLL